MIALGVSESARILRDAMVKFLTTDEGLDLVKNFQRPYFDYAEELMQGGGSGEDEGDENK
jgi:hypothetical protein